MQDIGTVIGLLVIVTLISVAAKKIAVPYPTLMVVCGLAIGIVPGLPEIHLNPDVALLIFLPPLLYSAAWMTSWPDFRANIRPIGMLAIGLVLATTISVAVVVHTIAPEIPWAVCFVLGALVSPPDAVAATAVTKGLSMPRRVVAILEGESLVNDATGLVAYRIAVTAVVVGSFSLAESVGEFFFVAIGGVLVGLAIGYVMSRIHRLLDDATIETAMTLLTPYLAYLPAEALHVSGVLSTVTAGIFLSRRSLVLFSSAMRLNANAVWDVLVFLLNGVTFVLIGLQLPTVAKGAFSVNSLSHFEIAAVTCAVVVIVRLVWVYPAALLPRMFSARLRARDPMPALGMLTVIGWAGMRGVVSLAAALALPLTAADNQPFPFRDLVIFITFCVILFTLVVQSLTLPLLIRAMGVSKSDKSTDVEEAEARLEILMAAFDFIDHAAAAGETDVKGLDHLRAQFERDRLQIQAVLATAQSTLVRRASVCKRLYQGALSAQQHRLRKMWRHAEYELALLHQLQRDLDLEEARLHLHPDPQSRIMLGGE